MEHEIDIILPDKHKERRRSSIFSYLKRQTKLSRQKSSPGYFSTLSLDRRNSTDTKVAKSIDNIAKGSRRESIPAESESKNIAKLLDRAMSVTDNSKPVKPKRRGTIATDIKVHRRSNFDYVLVKDTNIAFDGGVKVNKIGATGDVNSGSDDGELVVKDDGSDRRYSPDAETVCMEELAGASDSESDQCMATPTVHREKEILDRIEATYEEDPDRDVGSSGELVEDVAEENKSLLWFLLKQVRPGMDLSKVVLPTFILEPRSFLDKLADTHYHADLLAKSKSMDSPYNRFRCVLSWYLSGLYRKPKGLKKPYNPVLGESFRCCWKHDEGRTYYVAEQVSHHPPVSAFYVSNRKEGFVIEGSLLARSKFYGNSTSAILEGCARVHLLSWGETYVTTAPYAHCKGIVIGQLSMELGGKVFVTCAESGYSAEVEFKLRQMSFLGSAEQTNSIAGKIRKNKEVVATLDGYWDGKIDIKDKKTGETSTLLDVSVLKHQRLQRYLVKLSKQEDFESKRLWNKVSEAILKDDQVAATEAKTVIEEAQRVRARNVSTPWVPRYFYREHEPTTTDGVVDQGWRYTYKNVSPWQPEEVLEYEENFVIKTLTDTGGPVSRSSMPIEQPRLEDSRLRESVRRDPSRFSDSDVREDLARRSKTSNRTLKQSLYAIDTALREQTVALERLTRTVEAMSDHQKAPNTLRPQNVGRVPGTPQSWDLFGGFVIAMVLQALLNWIFYHQD